MMASDALTTEDARTTEHDALSTEHLATHVMSLEDAPAGYAMPEIKTHGCVRAVFQPPPFGSIHPTIWKARS